MKYWITTLISALAVLVGSVSAAEAPARYQGAAAAKWEQSVLLRVTATPTVPSDVNESRRALSMTGAQIFALKLPAIGQPLWMHHSDFGHHSGWAMAGFMVVMMTIVLIVGMH